MMAQKKFHTIFISCLCLLSLIYLKMLLHYCHVGIDLTDEGFYLNWIATPFNYSVSHTQFGYIYHPLYQLLGESLIRLRQADFLILLSLSTLVCHTTLKFLFRDHLTSFKPLWRYMLSFSMGIIIFCFFGAWWWIPTPSYNSLTLEALLIATLSFIHILDKPKKITGWCFLGISWWLAFMAKPTTAVALILYTTLLLLPIEKTLWKKYLLSTITTLTLLSISALIIDHGLSAFILRLYHGVNVMTLLYGGNAFEFISTSYFLNDNLLIFVFLSIAGITFLVTSTSTPALIRVQFILFIVLAYAIWVVIGQRGLVYPAPAPALNLWFFAVPVGASLAFLLIKKEQPTKALVANKQLLKLFLLLIALPYIFAIGTRGNIWTTAMRMGIFWFLAPLPLLAIKSSKNISVMQSLLSLTFCGLLITTLLTQYSMSFPYRQSQSLFDQKQTFEVENQQGKVTSRLIVSDQDKAYLEKMKTSAKQHGFHPGEAMIDLTGAFPSVLYLLGANPIGAPWYIAGFIGSTEFTIATLSETPCQQLTQAWLLTSLNGIEKYDPRILRPYGLSQEKYEQITDIIPAHSGLFHQYWKPKITDTALEQCEAGRIQLKEKQRTLSELMHHVPPLTERILEQAQLYMDKNQPQKALSLLESAVFINPSHPHIFNNLCAFYGIEKKYHLGIHACESALAIDPNFQLARNNLLWLIDEK